MKYQTVYLIPFGLLFLLSLSTGSVLAQTCQNNILLSTPTSDFTFLTGGLAEHKSTGLIWARCALGQQWDGQTCQGTTDVQTWSGSLQSAQTANAQLYLGHSDWRVPNIKELSSIVETSCFDPSINTTVFPNTDSVNFWSASVDADDSDFAWNVNFDVGFDDVGRKDVSDAVRLVRGGQSFNPSPTPDTSPDLFSLTAQIDVPKNSLILSNVFTVKGINAATDIGISNGQYRINNGAWKSSNDTVNKDDRVQVRHTSSSKDQTTVTTTLTLGDVSKTFKSTTGRTVISPPVDNTTPSTGEGFVTGNLTDLCVYDAVDSVTLEFSGADDFTQQSDDRGRYFIKLPIGVYKIEINDPNFKLKRSEVTVRANFKSPLDFALTPKGGCANAQQPAQSFKAIIVAGSGSTIAGGARNPIWPVTQEVTKLAYASLRQQGFNARDIRFFAADPLDKSDGLTLQPELNLESLAQSITEWASDVDQVLLYLVGHGGDSTLRLNGFQILSAQDLNTALDGLQQQINGKLVVVLEACFSGSFLDQLAAKDRIVITSTKADQLAVLAGASNQSFSHGFWPRLSKSGNVLDAFIDGSLAIANNTINSRGGLQKSLLDADSNGVFNKQDKNRLSGFCIGQCKAFADDIPVISSVGPSLELTGELELTLGAQVSELLNPLEKAWVSVQRPDYNFPDDVAISDLPVLPLNCNSDNFCQVKYTNFNRSGNYLFHFYAQDKKGLQAISKSLTIEQTVDSGILTTPNAVFQAATGKVTIQDVQVQNQHYQVALQLLNAPGFLFSLLEADLIAQQSHDFPALYDIFSLELSIPGVQVGNDVYDVVLKNEGDFKFSLDLDQTIKR